MSDDVEGRYLIQARLPFGTRLWANLTGPEPTIEAARERAARLPEQTRIVDMDTGQVVLSE